MDKEILNKLLYEPREGIRRLIEEYGGLVYSITYRRLQGSLSKEDIEECVSDIFYEVYRCREQIDMEKGSLKTFVLVVSKRQAIKYIERKTEKFKKVYMDDEEALDIEDGRNIENDTIKKEQSRIILQVIKALGEPDSTIVIQKYYYGLTAKEIGKSLGMTKNAVEKRAKRALEKLKPMLEEYRE